LCAGVVVLVVNFPSRHQEPISRCLEDRDCRQLNRLGEAVQIYLIEIGKMPPRLTDLLKLNKPEGNVVNPTELLDAWGHSIAYTYGTSSPRSFRLTILAAHHHPDGSGPSNDIVRDWQQ